MTSERHGQTVVQGQYTQQEDAHQLQIQSTAISTFSLLVPILFIGNFSVAM